MWIVIAVFLLIALIYPSGGSRRRGRALFRHTGSQWRRAYGRRAFLRLGGLAAGAALLAHSGADEAVDRWHREQVRGPLSNHLAEIFKLWGERFWYGVWGGLALVDWTWSSTRFSRWGRRNFEAMCVGLPTLWTLQRAGGADRPVSDWGRPGWRPLSRAGTDKTASGHTFMAAIPLLNLAHGAPGGAERAGARLASILTGWSRINDRKHYLSQVAFGYGIAWQAVESVQGPDEKEERPVTGPAVESPGSPE